MNAIPGDAPGKIPEDFEGAYAGLVELVAQISEGRIPRSFWERRLTNGNRQTAGARPRSLRPRSRRSSMSWRAGGSRRDPGPWIRPSVL